MATLKTQVGSPGARREVGHKVLAAAKVVDVKPVKARLAAFAKAHEAFVRAGDKVSAAEAVRDAAHAAVAAADVAQDAAIDALVLALVTAGAPRLSPLKGLSNLSPSDLKGLATAKEAKELQRVVAAITKRGAGTPALRRATKAAGEAAAAVVKAIASVVPREKLYQESLAGRDALSQPWETTLAYLKRSARVAEDDGATGLFAALFERSAEAPKKKKKPATAAGPVG
jgi:hypothetical protein